MKLSRPRKLVGIAILIAMSPIVAHSAQTDDVVKISVQVSWPSGVPAEGALVVAEVHQADISRNYSGLVAATSVTRGDGTALLSIVSNPRTRAIAARNGGWLNLDLVAFGPVPCDDEPTPIDIADCVQAATVGLGLGTTFSTYMAVVGIATPVLDIAHEGIGLVESQTNPAAEVVSMVLHTPLDPGTVGFGDVAGFQEESDGCKNEITVLDQKTPDMVVGEAHASGGTTVRYEYGRSANSFLEIYYKGEHGAWSGGSTVKMSNSVGATSIWNEGPWFGAMLTSRFLYYKEDVVAYCSSKGKYASYEYKRLRPVEWMGGTSIGLDTSGHDGWAAFNQARNSCPACYTPFRPGGEFVRDEGAGYTYTWENKVWNFGMSSQTHYSTRSRLSWKFNNTRPRFYLFGNDGAPASATRVFAN